MPKGSIGGDVIALGHGVVVDGSVRGLCRRRYLGHPRGCPNYGKRLSCPPQAPMISDVLALDKTIWMAWNEFDLAAHVARLRKKHPDWSDRQLRCCLYWQGTARGALRSRVETFLEEHPGIIPVWCPEACGVNVTETAWWAGVTLEWPPVNVARQVALLGYAKEA